MEITVQPVGPASQLHHADILPSTLNVIDIRLRTANQCRKRFLRHAFFFPKFANTYFHLANISLTELKKQRL